MSISTLIRQDMARGSMIREMFERGNQLRAQIGANHVFDFSLGNPDLEPPPEFHEALRLQIESGQSGTHGYMTNAGYLETRAAVAANLSREWDLPLTAQHVVMASGAAGALNVAMQALLDPGDEVIVLKPFFPEYGPYVRYHGGTLVPVATTVDFDIDIAAIVAALGPRTKALILTSPNNPTGRVYTLERLRVLAAVLERHCAASGRTVYLVSDEPYRYLVYQPGLTVAPSPLQVYANSLAAISHSKDLSIPGERVGALILHPDCPAGDELFQALGYCTRTLGFVNANALMQRVVRNLQGLTVDIAAYRRRRDWLLRELQAMGYEVTPPEGAFYLWVRCPQSDDAAFCRELAGHGVLVVPGSGFGGPGYFRIAYCVSDRTIAGALPIFARFAPQ